MSRFGHLVESLSTRARVIALLLFMVIPFSALLIYAAFDMYRVLEEHAKQETLQPRNWQQRTRTVL